MAQFTCTIDLDNAAFEDSPGHLGQIIQAIGVSLPSDIRAGGDLIRDLNGNTIGNWSITP